MQKPLPNYARMFQLIDEVFETRMDADQIQVTPLQLKKLERLHSHCLSEKKDQNGPVIWILLFPTSSALMNEFLNNRISEKALLTKTKMSTALDCIYLCSATTLPEYRKKGESKKLAKEAIEAIKKDYPIKTLFVWPFTEEGKALATSIATSCELELKFKQK